MSKASRRRRASKRRRVRFAGIAPRMAEIVATCSNTEFDDACDYFDVMIGITDEVGSLRRLRRWLLRNEGALPRVRGIRRRGAEEEKEWLTALAGVIE
jgi:hypothetical protein